MPVPVHHGVIVLLAGSNKFKYISLHVSAVFELHSGNNNGFLSLFFFFFVKQEHQHAKEFTPLMVFLGVLVLFYLLINNISKKKLNQYLI